MTILLYDYHELEERASKHLRVWKVWHIIIFILAVIFGVLNYTFLFETEKLMNNQCVFYPRELAFTLVIIPENERVNTSLPTEDGKNGADYDKGGAEGTIHNDDAQNNVTSTAPTSSNETDPVAQTKPVPDIIIPKQEAPTQNETTKENLFKENNNETVLIGNQTHRYMLNPNATLFPKETDTRCQFAEYMPLLSAVFAVVWMTFFIMCPNGGRTRTGLQEPWRILAPAIVFAFVMVILTGYSFTSTNGGLQAFCAAFYNYTNTTTCSAVNQYILRPNNTWSMGARIAATRAVSAGVWAIWSCACALMLARCLAAPDFLVRRTAAHLVRDPQNKVTPYLLKQKSGRQSQRSAPNSPSKRDTVSVRSEPTAITELVTASVEHEADSQPTSLAVTPLKERRGEELEMTYNPQERRYYD